MQHGYLLLCEVSPISSFESFLGEACEHHSVEFHHPVSQMLKDASYDSVLSRMILDAHLALVGVGCVTDGVGVYLTVFQFHTLCNPLEVGCGDVLVELDVVDLLFQELGMSEFGGKVAVVGEQQHASGVAVESAYRVNALSAAVLHQIHHRFPCLRVIA